MTAWMVVHEPLETKKPWSLKRQLEDGGWVVRCDAAGKTLRYTSRSRAQMAAGRFNRPAARARLAEDAAEAVPDGRENAPDELQEPEV